MTTIPQVSQAMQQLMTGDLPRPSVIAIQSSAGTPIGMTALAPASPNAPDQAQIPAALPRTGAAGDPSLWLAAAGLAAAAAGALLRRRGASVDEQAEDAGATERFERTDSVE